MNQVFTAVAEASLAVIAVASAAEITLGAIVVAALRGAVSGYARGSIATDVIYTITEPTAEQRDAIGNLGAAMFPPQQTIEHPQQNPEWVLVSPTGPMIPKSLVFK
jgi:Na+/phosphate symporter